MSQIELRRNKTPKLNRRSFLGCSGIAMSLPLLEAMLPTGKTAFAQSDTPSRFITMFTGNGMVMEDWTPTTQGRNFELSPSLAPLEPLKDKTLVLSGLHNLILPIGHGAHARGTGAFLTCALIKKTSSSKEVMAATSMDQIIAQQIGHATRFPSLNYALTRTAMPTSYGGASDNGYSSAYVHFISWSSPTTQVPNESDPRNAFDKLFSDTTNNAHLKRIAAYDKSVIDSVLTDAIRLEKQIGIKDKEKLQEYFYNIRALEKQISLQAKSELQPQNVCDSFERPALGGEYPQKSRIFNDLMVMALQCDLTRIVTYMFSSGQSNRPYSHLGLGGHHNTSRKADLKRIDRYHNEELTDLCTKLDSTIDVTGKSLLDSTVVYRGTEFRDHVTHSQVGLPIVLVGSCNGYFDTGQHLDYGIPNKPGPGVSSLYLSIMDAMGAPQTQFATSTEKLPMIKTNS